MDAMWRLLLVVYLAFTPQAANQAMEPPLLLEVTDARGRQDLVPVFAPPRQRYVIFDNPVATRHQAPPDSGRATRVGIRTFRHDTDVAVELLLILRGTPDTETTLATYRLAPGETATTSVLEEYGLAPVTLRAHLVEEVTTSAPAVENVGTTVVASVAVVAGAMPLYRVTLHNTSTTKAVAGVLLRLEFHDGTAIIKRPRSGRGRPLVEARATAIEGFHSRGAFRDNVFRPIPADRLSVVAVAYVDGSSDGEDGQADEIDAGLRVEAWQIRRALTLLESASRAATPPTSETLDGLRLELDRLSWDDLQVTAVSRECESCARVLPWTLGVHAHFALDSVRQDLESLASVRDVAERNARWSAYLNEYRAWAASTRSK